MFGWEIVTVENWRYFKCSEFTAHLKPSRFESLILIVEEISFKRIENSSFFIKQSLRRLVYLLCRRKEVLVYYWYLTHKYLKPTFQMKILFKSQFREEDFLLRLSRSHRHGTNLVSFLHSRTTSKPKFLFRQNNSYPKYVVCDCCT